MDLPVGKVILRRDFSSSSALIQQIIMEHLQCERVTPADVVVSKVAELTEFKHSVIFVA